MSLVEFAKSELESIAPEDELQQEMNSHILELIEVFSKQGHSGTSAGYLTSMLERLLRFLPVSHLTGEDDEWNEVGIDVYQNKRCSSVFKTSVDNDTAYTIYGKIFTRDGGYTWFTNKESFLPIEFPYFPPLNPERVFLEPEEDVDETLEGNDIKDVIEDGEQ